MYYSVYYNRGEATHGYHSVPALSGQPRLHPQPDPRLDLHLQLDRPRGQDVCLQLSPDRRPRHLIAELREHALVIGEVTLSSGRRASYYVDARRALLRPAGFRAAGELIAAAAARRRRRARSAGR